jgi:hypothetical protein
LHHDAEANARQSYTVAPEMDWLSHAKVLHSILEFKEKTAIFKQYYSFYL